MSEAKDTLAILVGGAMRRKCERSDVSCLRHTVVIKLDERHIDAYVLIGNLGR